MADDDTNAGLRGRDLASLGGLLVGAVVGGMLLGLLVDDVAQVSVRGGIIDISSTGVGNTEGKVPRLLPVALLKYGDAL